MVLTISCVLSLFSFTVPSCLTVTNTGTNSANGIYVNIPVSGTFYGYYNHQQDNGWGIYISGSTITGAKDTWRFFYNPTKSASGGTLMYTANTVGVTALNGVYSAAAGSNAIAPGPSLALNCDISSPLPPSCTGDDPLGDFTCPQVCRAGTQCCLGLCYQVDGVINVIGLPFSCGGKNPLGDFSCDPVCVGQQQQCCEKKCYPVSSPFLRLTLLLLSCSSFALVLAVLPLLFRRPFSILLSLLVFLFFLHT